MIHSLTFRSLLGQRGASLCMVNPYLKRSIHHYPNLKQAQKSNLESSEVFNESKPLNPTVAKIIEKLPMPLQKYGHRLANSPVSHITSFLILHELSAVIPFIGLWYVFHELQFLPTDIPSWVIVKGTKFAEAVIGDGFLNSFNVAARSKLLIEGASAYGIIKFLFPLRVVGSVMATPWFARVLVEPLFRVLKKIFGFKRK